MLAQEKGRTLYRKNMRKKIRTVIIYSGKVLKRVVCDRKGSTVIEKVLQ